MGTRYVTYAKAGKLWTRRSFGMDIALNVARMFTSRHSIALRVDVHVVVDVRCNERDAQFRANLFVVEREGFRVAMRVRDDRFQDDRKNNRLRVGLA